MAKVREVTVPIVATSKHCNADCAGLEHMSQTNRYCTYFSTDLDWDPKKTFNGCIRLSACRDAEQRAEVINLKARHWDVVRARQ